MIIIFIISILGLSTLGKGVCIDNNSKPQLNVVKHPWTWQIFSDQKFVFPVGGSQQSYMGTRAGGREGCSSFKQKFVGAQPIPDSMKKISLNVEYKLICEGMIDNCSHTHNLKMKFKHEKSRPERNSNPWPLRYQCNALPTELSCEFVIYLYMAKNTSEYMKDHMYNCHGKSYFYILICNSNIWSFIHSLVYSV